MTGTIPKSRTSPRPKAVAPSIREVCLVGSLHRTYIHATLGGLRTEDSGPSKALKAGAG
jgi:hypothetical protein